jgi:choloylglycine hydrolase
MHLARSVPFLAVSLIAFAPMASPPCSSFTLETQGVLIVGRNLDSSGHVPGVLVVNKRGVQKQGRSFEWLVSGESDAPLMSWVSEYGSLSFNVTGVEFPDGGVNEAGLAIEEMTLLETVYPSESSQPKLFMQQWIQYVLDTCATVGQVVQSARAVAIDGWNWHFYAVDRNGDSAVIEFLDGEASVHMGASLPHTVLCNDVYAKELDRLTAYEGFGGERAIDLDDPSAPRFVQGAQLVGSFPADEDPTDYGFRILDAMSRGTTRWSKIVDLRRMRVSFRTDVNPRLRSVDLVSFDFSAETPRLLLDIHAALAGDVRSAFQEYTGAANRALVEKAIADLAQMPEFESILSSLGGTREGMTRRIFEQPGATRPK